MGADEAVDAEAPADAVLGRGARSGRCGRQRRPGWGPRLLATELQTPHATVWRCLRRRGCSRPPRPAPEEVLRFERPCPGDLLQMGTKRLARFTRPGHAVTRDRFRTAKEKSSGPGWEFVNSIVDDHTRLAHSEIHRANAHRP